MAEEDDDIDCSSMADFLKSIESSDDEDDSKDKDRRQFRCNLPRPEATQNLCPSHTEQRQGPAATTEPTMKPAAMPSRRMVSNSYAQRQGPYTEHEDEDEKDAPTRSACTDDDDDDALNLAAIRAISKEERDPTELTSILKEVDDVEYGKTLKREMLAGGLDGCVIDQVLSRDECTALIDATERMGFTFWNVARYCDCDWHARVCAFFFF
jgi:hypothetical protein